MCNINLIVNRKGFRSTKIAECMNVVSFNSYMKNNDAEGWYNDTFKVNRSLDKLVMKGKSSLMISHQRISTSGKNEEMTQPLESANFILTHNGVLTELGSYKESDSYEFLQKLEALYAKKKDTKKCLVELLAETGGRYSMVLYNKETKEHLYFKEKAASMYMAMSEEHIMMATVKENVEYMTLFFDNDAEVSEVTEGAFFDLNDSLNNVGLFKAKTYEHLSKKEKKRNRRFGTDNVGSYRNSVNSQYLDDDDREEIGRSNADGIKELFQLEDMRPSRRVDKIRRALGDMLDSYGVQYKALGMHGDHILATVYTSSTDIFESSFRSWSMVKEIHGKKVYEVTMDEVKVAIKSYIKYFEDAKGSLDTYL